MMILDSISSNRVQLSKFVIVGVLGNIVAWLIYTAIYHTLTVEQYKPTISWIISYHLGVIIQHFFHRRTTFSEVLVPYLPSLIKTYLSYLIVFVISLVANFLFNEHFHLYHHLSILLTLIIAVPFSFITLKYYAFKKSEPTVSDSSKD
jgi:putative flippase GtrA